MRQASLYLALLVAICLLVSACGEKSTRKGGVAGTKPYTVLGKTYYPLKSAHGFEEVGVASWYGPGFHGKKTASGERYNQYEMTAAHKLLPLGTKVRVTHLGNGKSVLVKINDRGPFVADRVIDLSRAAATRIGMMGKGTAKVRVQSLGGLVETTPEGEIKGEYYIQIGAFGVEGNARRLSAKLAKAGTANRIVFGSNNLWNVQIGPWPDSGEAKKMLPVYSALYPHSFVVSGK